MLPQRIDQTTCKLNQVNLFSKQ